MQILWAKCLSRKFSLIFVSVFWLAPFRYFIVCFSFCFLLVFCWLMICFFFGIFFFLTLLLTLCGVFRFGQFCDFGCICSEFENWLFWFLIWLRFFDLINDWFGDFDFWCSIWRCSILIWFVIIFLAFRIRFSILVQWWERERKRAGLCTGMSWELRYRIERYRTDWGDLI